MEIKIYGEDSPLSGGTRYVTAISAETGFFDSFTITDIQSGSSVASLFITESGSVISGETNNFTGDTYWASGTTGTTSIKAINSTGLDSTGNRSVAWGNQTLALGDDSTAWGYLTTAGWKGFTVSSVVAGLITISDNVDYSTEFTSGTVLLDSTQYTYNTVTFSSPNFTIQLNDTTVNTGTYVSDLSNLNSPLATVTVGNGAHSAGDSTKSLGNYSHAEGRLTISSGSYSHAEGGLTTAIGDYSHAEGESTTAFGSKSHAEGYYAISSGSYSHAEGANTITSGSYSHAEGDTTIAYGQTSHAEGQSTTAYGQSSHAEGLNTIAIGNWSHAEGQSTTASGDSSHAEGLGTTASGANSHAEGNGTISSGSYSHAEGVGTQAIGDGSHAEGIGTIASGSGQLAAGQYNTHGNTDSLVVIGNGTDDANRSDLALFNSTSITFNQPVTGSLFSGSFYGTFSGSTDLPDLTEGTGIEAFTYDGGATATVAVSGAASLSSNTITKWTGTAFADTSITDDGALITFDNNAVFNGDIIVQGTASFQNTENLLVADRFVLFASGSSTSGDGGIIVQQGTQNVGELFGYENSADRWGFTSSFDASSTSYTPAAFVAAVIDMGAGQSDIAQYQKNGNIKIDTGDIWIYA